MAACDVEKVLVDGVIGRKLGMKRGSENAALLHEHRMPGIFRQNFHAWADGFDNRGANEHHFERFFVKLRRAAVNVACELAAVAVPQHGDVD